MDFLDKLYSNDYFGIGLFIVISFLVVTFLIVLFFGKRDEKKRKLEETNKLKALDSTTNGFKEVSTPTPVEVPTPVVDTTPILEPVSPINLENTNNSFVENLDIDPVKLEPIVETIGPVVNPVPIEPITPIKLESIKPSSNIVNEPVNVPDLKEVNVPHIEPIKINIPDEPINNTSNSGTPIIKEKVEPIILNSIDTPHLEENNEEPKSFYHEKEYLEAKPVEVPNIDFDAIAKSISKELEDLENNNKENINKMPRETVNKPREQFSSVYISESAKVNTIPKTKIVLPKKIDLPNVKQNEEIEPESYQL